MKELFIDAHEQLIQELMENNPNMTWDQAYEKATDSAYDRMRENLADRADGLRLRKKEQS